jgi:hypothetical protein
MARSEYLETIEGQSYERLKRGIKTVYLEIEHEPKSKKSITKAEKLYFRKEVKNQLKKQNRRPHKGDIILEIDYFTTEDNPPALHTLSKNYLDLLHKPMPEVDKLRGLLFKDDSQIKILISNYHLNEFGNQRPHIRIKSYSLSNFYLDVELTDRITTNKFDNSDSDWYLRFEDEFQYDHFDNNTDAYEDLKDLRENKQKYIDRFGEPFFALQEHFYARQIQEQYLKINEFKVRDLISIFQSEFSYNKKYTDDFMFQKIWNSSKNLIFFASDFLELGEAPSHEGDTSIFKDNLQKGLIEFKNKHKILFPILQPISILITFIPPKYNVVDLDNLARYIVPFVNEILKPPASLKLTYDRKYLNNELKKEVEIMQRFPPNSISSYQIIYIPRKENDPQNGEIKFVITDGLKIFNNVWTIVNETIEKWEHTI